MQSASKGFRDDALTSRMRLPEKSEFRFLTARGIACCFCLCLHNFTDDTADDPFQRYFLILFIRKFICLIFLFSIQVFQCFKAAKTPDFLQRLQ